MPPSATPATSPALRRMTLQSVLDALVATRRCTAADVMAATGLSRPTVHAVCDQLIEAGWVVEHEVAASGTGRPARTYELDGTAGHVVAVDLGVHTVRAVVADLRGAAVAEQVAGLRDFHVGGPERVAVVQRCVAAALAQAGVPPASVLAATVGVPAPVDAGRVVTTSGYLPGLARIDLRRCLDPLLPGEVAVDNDANLAAVGERWKGAAQGVDDVVVLLAGERLGAGLVLGGRLLRGAGGAAGELGFLGLVEGVGNTDAIGGMARELGAVAVADLLASPDAGAHAARPGWLLERCGGRPHNVTAEHVVQAARDGDPDAGRVLDVVTERMARVVAVVGTLLDPALVVVGGAVAEAADMLLPRLEAGLRDLVASPPRLVMSTLGEHAVVTGAVRVGLDRALTLGPGPLRSLKA